MQRFAGKTFGEPFLEGEGTAPRPGRVKDLTVSLACEQGEWKERGGGKGSPVGMAKGFDFQMPVIHAMFKLAIWVISTTTTSNLE